MFVKQSQKFVSKVSGNLIKVTRIRRSSVDNRYDVCTVADAYTSNGRVVPGTHREIFADSIRRRYLQA